MSAVRYVCVGVVVYLIDMGSFILALKLGVLNAINANILGKLLGGTFGFFAHRHFTFRVKTNEYYIRHAIKYFTILIVYAPFSSLVLKFCLMIIHHNVAAKFCSDAICIVLSYILSKYIIFHRKKVEV